MSERGFTIGDVQGDQSLQGALTPEPAAPEAPGADSDELIVAVAVDTGLAHLDRLFDYTVPPAMAEQAQPGVRVRVRFAGRLCDGFLITRDVAPEPDRRLSPVHKIVSPEPVLSPDVVRLVRAVADHYAGTFSDVVRLAVPPRHATSEKAARRERPAPDLGELDSADQPLAHYPQGPRWLEGLSVGGAARAFWQVSPTASTLGNWAAGFAGAAATALQAGRGSILIVPEASDVASLAAACTRVLGASGFVTLTADSGPAARYRAFLALARGEVSVVIGTRSAAFAPVANLGLLAVWDDGSDQLSEPRAPYPHARDVLAIRAGLVQAEPHPALLMASYSRTAEVQQWIERGWLVAIEQTAGDRRRSGPLVRVAADTDWALERDPHARAARVPHDVFTALRAGLAQGPVLIQVPRSGYQQSLVCQDCRTSLRCRHCHGPIQARSERDESRTGAGQSTLRMDCRWCGRGVPAWKCEECGSRRWRSPVVGSARTAEEFGKAFPQTPIVRSYAEHIVADIEDKPALVVATPGAEPHAPSGYAATILLDTALLLGRVDLRAGEEGLRRMLTATALTRPGSDGGTVVAVGDAGARALQALVRLDPGGFAERELAERRATGLPPTAKFIHVEGRASALREFVEFADFEKIGPSKTSAVSVPPASPASPAGPAEVSVLGPIEAGLQPGSEAPLFRLTVRAPAVLGGQAVREAKVAAAQRSARKCEGGLRVQVDPVVIG